ncbi:hypothetical protein Indivirus_4_20 [Indivirus ILV1]|uniref:Late transcription factor VLTF3-like protein n=1 Tax=Indivirus ILV1 TaxID=1977633 RepID=A0A1V0SDW4_9VIRU|nr:hypothetical protein Indivirus_4_20 [Indivirus ILV1]
MSTFKIKHDRNKTRVRINTLDETHKKIMGDFEKKRGNLPGKKKKLELLQNQLKILDNTNQKEYSIEDIKKKAELKTEISNLQDQIYDIENDISELDYYSKIGDVVMDYYDIIEMNDNDLYQQYPELGEKKEEKENKEVGQLDKLNIMNQVPQRKVKTSKKRKRGQKPTMAHSIIDFMSGSTVQEIQKNNETETETEIEAETEAETEIDPVDIVENKQEKPLENKESQVQQDSVINKAKLMDQYMMLIDSDYLVGKNNMILIKRCLACDIEKTLIHAEGIYVCRKCGEAEPVIIDSEKPNYKESVPDNKPSMPYRKANHLNEWLKEVGHKSTYLKVCASYIYRKSHKYVYVAIFSNCGKLLSGFKYHPFIVIFKGNPVNCWLQW